MNERPLVAFTLLTQMGVGGFLAMVAVDLCAARLGTQASIGVIANEALLVIVPLVIGGLLSSLLHLGTPRNAWRAVANVRTSWLSREVLFALVFCCLASAFTALRWSGVASPSWLAAAATAAAIAGIALVYAMARVYRLRTVPAWNTPLTTLSFFTTTLLLGSLLVATLVGLIPGVPEVIASTPLHQLALVAAGCFALEIAIEERGTPDGRRRLLLLAGLGLCGAQVLSGGRVTTAVVFAFAIAIATQTLARYRFYVQGLRRTL